MMIFHKSCGIPFTRSSHPGIRRKLVHWEILSTSTLTVEILMTASIWKQPRYSHTDGRVKTICHLHTLGGHWARREYGAVTCNSRGEPGGGNVWKWARQRDKAPSVSQEESLETLTPELEFKQQFLNLVAQWPPWSYQPLVFFITVWQKWTKW